MNTYSISVSGGVAKWLKEVPEKPKISDYVMPAGKTEAFIENERKYELALSKAIEFEDQEKVFWLIYDEMTRNHGTDGVYEFQSEEEIQVVRQIWEDSDTNVKDHCWLDISEKQWNEGARNHFKSRFVAQFIPVNPSTQAMNPHTKEIVNIIPTYDLKNAVGNSAANTEIVVSAKNYISFYRKQNPKWLQSLRQELKVEDTESQEELWREAIDIIYGMIDDDPTKQDVKEMERQFEIRRKI